MENGLEVNAAEGKYMEMFLDQKTCRSQSMKINNSSFDGLGQFKYFGTTLTNQNSMLI
jgi:hypothetical protein